MDIRYPARRRANVFLKTTQCIALLLPFLGAQTALAVSPNWLGTTNSVWGTGTNWTGGVAPVLPADTANFTGAPPANQPSTAAVTSLLGINFTGATGSYVIQINNNPFTIGAGGIVNPTAFTQNILVTNSATTLSLQGGDVSPKVTITSLGPISLTGTANATGATVNSLLSFSISGVTGAGAVVGSLSGNGTVDLGGKVLTVGSLNNSTNISGVISGADGQLTKVGTGTLTLSAANTYTGLTTISAGTLLIGQNGVLPSVAVMNNGTLAFGHSDTVTYGGIVAGTGALQQTGTGTLILTGDNLYTGGTTVAQGTLSLGNGGSTGSVQGNIFASTSSSNVTFNHSNDVLYPGAISGSGTMTKLGAGTLTVTGNNTYAGITTVNAGTLQIGNGGTTGSIAGDFTGTGTVSFNQANPINFTSAVTGTALTLSNIGSGNLIVTGSISPATLVVGSQSTIQLGNGTTAGVLSSASTTINNSGTFIINRSDDFNWFQAITGAGQIIKQNTNNITLLATNTNSGTLFINAGTLTVGNGILNNGTLSGGPIVNNATLVFNRPDAVSFFSGISGPGTVVKNGLGTLTFGATTYTGDTIVNVGNLILNSNPVAGNIQVNNGGLVTFNNGTSTAQFTYQSVISGAGSVVMNAAGSVTLTGDQTYAGSTTLTRGTLNLGNGGTTGSLTGAVVMSGGNLNFNQSSSNVVYPNVISGSGGTVTQSGTGTLTFVMDQTYTSPTIVNTGTISLGNGGIGGNLQSTSIALNSIQSGLLFNQSDASTYAGVISGVGTVTQMANSVLTLTGNNTFTGALNIAAGTVQLGNGISSSGSIATSTVVDQGSLVFNTANPLLVYSGVISGTGTLTQAGLGTLVLSGANTYTGGTTISSGTLQIGNGSTSGSIVGDIVNNSTLAFNTSSALVYNDTISGTGAVQQNGTSTVTLNGVNTYAGQTTVNAGTLLVGGASGSSATVAGDVVVNAGGTLGGFGTIAGNVTNNGAVAPGASIGTLNVVGNYTQSPNGTFNVEVNRAGQSDLLAVTGTATVAGTLTISSVDGFVPGHTYTFLTAGNGITGSFSNVNALGQFAQNFFTVQLTQGANSLSLSPSFSATALAAVANTANRRAFVKYLLAGGGTSGLQSLIENLTSNAQFSPVVDNVMAAIYPNQQLQLAQTGSWFDRQMSDRMSGYPCAVQPSQQLNVWIAPYGSSASIDNNNSGGLDTGMGGLALGVDMSLSPVVKVGAGIAATYFSSDATGLEDANDTGGLFQVGVYGDYQVGDWSLGAGVDVGGTSDIDTTRNVLDTTTSTVSSQEGSYTATLVTEQVKATYALMLEGNAHLRPFIGVVNQNVSSDAFNETGSAATFLLDVQSGSYNSFKGQAGASLDVPMAHNVTFVSSLAWQHEFADTFTTVDATMPGSTASTEVIPITGTDIGRDSALVKVGLVLMQKDRMNVTAMYEGTYATAYSESGGKLQLNFILG